jgi:hypothetical protein
MKFLNIFKKGTKKTTTSNVQTINKAQLEKVVGGTETVKTTSIQDEGKGFSSLIR